MAVRQMYDMGCNVEDKSLTMLTTIKMFLKELENSNLSSENAGLKFDLMYHKMQLEEDFAGIKEIYLHYHEKGNIIMKLISFHYWIQCNPSCIFDTFPGDGSILRCMLDFVNNVFDFINELFVDSTTGRFATIIEDCFFCFGLKQSALNGNVYMVDDETRFLYFMKFSKTRSYDVEKPQNGGMINLNRVTVRIARIFLKLLDNFISLLYTELISNLKHATSSLHTDGCYYAGCTVSHDLPTAVSFASGRNTAVSLFELRALCQEANNSLKKIISIQNDVKWLDTIDQSNELLEDLCRFIFGYIPFLHVLNQWDFLDSFSKVPEIVSSQMISCVRQVWKMYEEKKLCVDINVYIQLSFLSYLFDRSGPVADELLTTASTYDQNWKEHYQILLHFNQYLTNLYYDYHIVSACRDIHYVTSKCFSKNAIVKPTLLTVCELLELPIMVLLVTISKLTQASVYFPNANIHYKNFCNLLYSVKDQSGIDIAVKRLHPSRKGQIGYALRLFLNLLVGNDSSKVNPISMMSDQLASFNAEKSEPAALRQLHCERLLIIYLVFLINFPEGMTGGKVIISAFRSNFVKGEGKLLQVFNAVPTLRNRPDAKELLSDLLKTKNGRLVEYNFNREQFQKRYNKAPNNTPENQWKIMSRKVTEGKPIETVDNAKELVEDRLDDAKINPQYSSLNEAEVVNEDKCDREENRGTLQNDLSLDLNDNVNEVPLNDAEFSDLNEAEFVEDSNMLEEVDDPNVAEKDDLNEDADEHLNKAKAEKERKIKESMTATYIQKWWKKVLNKRRTEINMRNNFAASKIQIWWKKMVLKSEEVKNMPSRSLIDIHAEYFDSFNNVCVACNCFVVCKEDHLRESSMHHKMAELYGRFKVVSNSICQLNVSFDEYADSPGVNVVEDEIARSKIMVKYASSKKLKNWGDSQELEILISTLMTKINGVTDQTQYDEDEEFEEFEHKQKRNTKGSKRPGKSKKRK